MDFDDDDYDDDDGDGCCRVWNDTSYVTTPINDMALSKLKDGYFHLRN